MNKSISIVNLSDNRISDLTSYLDKLRAFNKDIKVIDGISKKDNSQNKILDLINSCKNKEIGAVLCSNGGTSSINLINDLDEFINSIKTENQKPLIGYSDIDHLTLILSSKGYPTINGYCLKDLCEYHSKEDFDVLLDILDDKNVELNVAETFNLKENIKGKIVAAHLQILSIMLPHLDKKFIKNKILFIEDHNNDDKMVNYFIDYLINTGVLSQLKGLVFGDMRKCLSKKDIISNISKKVKIPLINISEWSYIPNYYFCEVSKNKVHLSKNEIN